MKQEDKELLLKDICARLPYKTIANIISLNYTNKNWIVNEGIIRDIKADFIDDIKPYLRSMFNMTEKENKEYRTFLEDINGYCYSIDCVSQIDWLNAHYFDYRGLIEKGLALEAPKDMYKIED